MHRPGLEPGFTGYQSHAHTTELSVRCLHMHSLSLPHLFMYRSFVSTNEALLLPVLLMTVSFVDTNDTVNRKYEWYSHSYIRMIQSIVYTNGYIIRIYEWVVHSYIQMTVSFVDTNGCIIRIYEWLQPIEQRRVMAVNTCCGIVHVVLGVSIGFKTFLVPTGPLLKAIKGRHWSPHTPLSQPSRHSYLRMPVPSFQWPSPAKLTSNAPKRKADLTKVAPSPADSLKRPPNTTPTSVWGHPRAIPSFTCKMLSPLRQK